MFSYLFSPLAKFISAAFLSLSVLFSHGAGQTTLSGAIQPAADFRSSLVSGITAAATSMTLVSTSTASGEALVSGQTYGFKLGGREYVLGTLSAGKVISGMTRGVSLITGTTTGGTAEIWGRGTAVEITDAPILLQISNKVSGREYFDNALTYAQTNTTASSSNQIPAATWVYNNFVNKSETQSITASLTNGAATSTFTQGIYDSAAYRCQAGASALTLCDKSYVDSVAVAGASNADTTTKGIVEIATQAEVSAGTAVGGTGASLVLTPATYAQMASTTATYSTSTDLMTGTSTSITMPATNGVREMTVHFAVGSSSPSTSWRLSINNSLVPLFFGSKQAAGGVSVITSTNLPQVTPGVTAAGGPTSLDMTISSSTKYKIIHFASVQDDAVFSLQDQYIGILFVATTVPITTISLSPASASASHASTTLTVFTR